MAVIEEAKERSAHLRNLFCRYSDYLLAQIMQTVACNSFHPIEARAARWLLTAHDRAGSRLELTQESLAGLLGVQRTTVNAVARELQDEGLITTRRGIIEVHDRDGLERRSCECYDRVERFFGDMVGEGRRPGYRQTASRQRASRSGRRRRTAPARRSGPEPRSRCAPASPSPR